MNRVDTILREYQEADDEKRLYLFLTHRQLRPEFMAIKEWSGVQAALKVGKKQQGSIRRCRRWCLEKLLPFPV